MKPGEPLTPKEFADEAFCGKRTAKWVCAEIRAFIRSKGKRGIAVITASRPYLIPASEVERFKAPHLFAKRAAVRL